MPIFTSLHEVLKAKFEAVIGLANTDTVTVPDNETASHPVAKSVALTNV